MHTAEDGLAAVEQVRVDKPDVVVLDLMLPGLDGIEVCRQIRTFSDTYVLTLTARSEEIDRIKGLSVGADDFLVKPFSPRELVARVKALLRRPRSATPTPTDTNLVVDPARRAVTVRGDPIILTATELSRLQLDANRRSRTSAQQQWATAAIPTPRGWTRRQCVALVGVDKRTNQPIYFAWPFLTPTRRS